MTVRNENFDGQSLIDPNFWKRTTRFINCSFRGAYLGSSSRAKKFSRIDFSKVVFRECDFEGCNFKGAKKLTFRNFYDPKNIATAHHLPPGVLSHFKNTPCSYSDPLRTRYREARVTNRMVTAKSPQDIGRYLDNGA